MVRKIFPIPLISTALLFLPVSSFCETIKLKNGRTVEGEIIERTDEFIKINYYGVSLTYYFEDIKSVDGEPVKKEEMDATIASEEVPLEHPPGFYYEKGVVLAAQGNLEIARKEFERALKVDPFHNETRTCVEIMEDMVKGKITREVALNIFQATYYSKLGRTQEALKRINVALRFNPDYPITYISRGFLYATIEDYNNALCDFTRVVELAPNMPDTYNNRGIIYRSMGLHDKAISDYTQAIELKSNFAEAYLNRGRAYDAKGLYDQAISDYTKAIKINPKYAEAYANRGFIYYNKGLYEQAIKDCNVAIEINPSLAGAYNNRAITYSRLGQYGLAIEDYNKAIPLEPDNPEYYYNKAIDCEKASRIREAIEAYESFIRTAPSDRYGTHVKRAKQKIKRLRR
ncbi:MAG: tetratricopeptide repeat protein [Candidatus Omnitrophica bacterium]|nr:tetratricopeptide repeat protein [Candidatus Omnitrophota bacterium]MBU1367632.1 tetratricopeptide repeat protein [Candidatus Omnitrophota bacterium]MBU1523591.1 tetratricopeptide repeat protein [Candidatus Omnitrophota bacterium]MBU1811054.1 tetratricopeptide repeat protein [Candidatus Omnitrophota bacterium]MBU2436107.1 tetratricopeptide repeat protein [Candidatus Omnitrophota bacterium]